MEWQSEKDVDSWHATARTFPEGTAQHEDTPARQTKEVADNFEAATHCQTMTCHERGHAACARYRGEPADVQKRF